MKLTISEQLRSVAPRLVLGTVDADVTYEQRNDELWRLLQKQAAVEQQALKAVDMASIPAIVATRSVYRALGKDPSRYRGSAEALLRRLSAGHGLYQVNNVVDVNNLISLETRQPVGVYDWAKLSGGIEFRVGAAGEAYAGIGKESLKLENLPVFADELGPFGSPTSDSRRAMITPETRRVRMIIIAFAGPEGLSEALQHARECLESYAGANNIACARSDS